MPYKLKSVGKGKYKVCKKKGSKCFSKKGLSKAQAQKQMKAIYRNENMKQESFDQLVNGYLSKFIFEDVPANPNQIANTSDPETVAFKKSQEEEINKKIAIKNQPVKKEVVDAYMQGAKAGQSGMVPKQ